MLLGASSMPITKYPVENNYLTEQKAMSQNQDDESGETTPLIFSPLTPDEWERNQAIADELLDYVLGDEPEKAVIGDCG